MRRFGLSIALLLLLPGAASAATTTVRVGSARASAGDGASALTGVTSVLRNGSPAALRIASYSLDELTSAQRATANVLTYHGGSDWRDDYRIATTATGAFDDEGEVVRFDDGTGSGWFFVSE